MLDKHSKCRRRGQKNAWIIQKTILITKLVPERIQFMVVQCMHNPWHSYKTLPSSSSSPGAISICTIPSLQGPSGYRDHAIKYMAHRYNKAKSDIIRTKINPSCVHRGLCDSETCVTCHCKIGEKLLLLTSLPGKQTKWKDWMVYFW